MAVANKTAEPVEIVLQSEVYADHKWNARASVNTTTGTALVRFDPNLGMRSRGHRIALSAIDGARQWRC